MSMRPENPVPEDLPFVSPIADVLEMLPCVVFTLRLTGTRSAVIPYATGKLPDLAGLDPQEVAQDAAPFLSRIDPDDVDRFFAAAEASGKSMAIWHSEFRFDHPRKNTVWIDWQAKPVRRQGQIVWQGVMCDVTERMLAERTQSQGEQSYRNLAESSPDFVIRYDLDHRIRYLNAKLVRQLKLASADEVLGRHPIEIWPDGRFAAIDEAARQACETGDEVTVELKVVNDDGSAGHRQILVVPERDENGCLIGTLAFGRDITHLKRMESRLRERNAFQKILLDAINDVGMQVMVIENGQIIHVSNRSLADEFGYSDEEIAAGIPLIDIIHPDDRERLLDIQRHRLHGANSLPSTDEFGLVTKQGERREYEASVAVVPDSHPPRFVTIGKDITQRKRTERELQLLQRAINQSTEPLFITDSTSMNFTIVNDAACRSLGYSREELQAMTVVDINPDFASEETRQAIAATEIGNRYTFESQHRRKDGRLFPVEISGSFFMSGGIRYSVAIARDITERKRTESTLRFIADHRGERDFLTTLALHLSETLRVACVVIERLLEEHDESETLVFCADGSVRPDIHHALGDIPKHHLTDNDCCYPKGMQAFLPKGSLLSELGVDCCACLSLRDSTGRPIGLIAVMDSAPLHDETAVMQLLQIVAPSAAAELERAENDRQLQLREAQFRSLAENSPDNIIRYDRECRLVYANPIVSQFLMAALGRIPVGETPNEANPDGSFRDYEATLRRVIASGCTEDLELTRPDTVGDVQHHMIRMAAEKNEAGEVVGAIAIGRDITAIRESEHRLYLLEYAMERMRDGSVLLNQQGNVVDVNRGICDMLGYEKSELLEKPVFDIVPNLTPENWDDHWKAISQAGGVMQIETINRARDGHDIPTEVSISLFEFEGETYNLATVRDITERRQNEEQLRMAASVFEAATEGILITDPSGAILDTNPAFTTISGYRREEVLGERPSLLASGRHDKAFYRAMWNSLLGRGTWSGEVVNRRKNGELYTEQLNIVTVSDELGTVKYYVGIFSDISLLKQQEQHLQHLAHHDGLTGLPNRLLLTDRLSHAIAQARRDDRMLAVIYLDLDGFKPINDTHGHEVGDYVLVETAHRLSVGLRASDTVARIGGDEFVALLAGVSDMGECEDTARRLLELISRPIVHQGRSLKVTASIGVCIYPNDAQDDADMLLRCADQAMYLAKNAGRNRFVFYGSHTRDNA